MEIRAHENAIEGRGDGRLQWGGGAGGRRRLSSCVHKPRYLQSTSTYGNAHNFVHITTESVTNSLRSWSFQEVGQTPGRDWLAVLQVPNGLCFLEGILLTPAPVQVGISLSSHGRWCELKCCRNVAYETPPSVASLMYRDLLPNNSTRSSTPGLCVSYTFYSSNS